MSFNKRQIMYRISIKNVHVSQIIYGAYLLFSSLIGALTRAMQSRAPASQMKRRVDVSASRRSFPMTRSFADLFTQ